MSDSPIDNAGERNKPNVSVSISENAHLEFPDERTFIDSLADALHQILIELDLFTDPQRTELGVAIVDDRKIRELNLQYRGLDKATDVLSFPIYAKYEIPADLDSDDPPRAIGDLVLSVETISRQAHDRVIEFSERFTECFIHGVLHLLGYEHGEDEDREKMEKLEDRLFGVVHPIL